MKAWIARDADGDATLWSDDPAWIASRCGLGFMWDGNHLMDGFGEDQIELLADSLKLKPGHKQPIELAAVPLGPAVRGGGE